MSQAQRILVTGAAGFIGYHLALRFLNENWNVVGLDNINSYYDVGLKKSRLVQLNGHSHFRFLHADISDRSSIKAIFAEHAFPHVVHLAAQAGVRYSLENPDAYIDSNIVGFQNVLEECRRTKVRHLIYASSSSVYGANSTLPFSEHDGVDHPVNLYAATKRANELQAHSYSWLYGLPTTGLRFFTVYGPWGRPDMAPFLFTKSIEENRPIEVFNNGQMWRDFTYVDDIIEGIVRLIDKAPKPNPRWDPGRKDPSMSSAPFRILNIGRGHPVQIDEFIEALELSLGKKAIRNNSPMQSGELISTHANIRDLEEVVGYSPQVTVKQGVQRFVEWYRDYYR